MKFILKIIDRLKEPSTYASLAAMLGVFGVSLNEGLWQNIVYAVTGIAGIIGFFLAEKSGEAKESSQ